MKRTLTILLLFAVLSSQWTRKERKMKTFILYKTAQYEGDNGGNGEGSVSGSGGGGGGGGG